MKIYKEPTLELVKFDLRDVLDVVDNSPEEITKPNPSGWDI